MKTPLKDALREMFDDVSLSADERAALHASVQKKAAPPTQMSRRRLLLAAASVSGLALVGHLGWRYSPLRSPVERALEELARTHTAQRPLQISAGSVPELRAEFVAEGFVLQTSAPMAGLPGQIMGARHCWLLGQPAAEIRYALADGAWATLMQAGYEPRVFGKLPDIGLQQEPLLRFIKGLRCSLWCDMGLVFAKARPA